MALNKGLVATSEGPHARALGWSDIKLLLQSQNSKADYDSMFIPEQLLSKVFTQRMFHFLQNWSKKTAFLHSKNGIKIKSKSKWFE